MILISLKETQKEEKNSPPESILKNGKNPSRKMFLNFGQKRQNKLWNVRRLK